MTIQQLYDKALDECALNYEITLYGTTNGPIKEEDVIFDHKRKCLEFKV